MPPATILIDGQLRWLEVPLSPDESVAGKVAAYLYAVNPAAYCSSINSSGAKNPMLLAKLGRGGFAGAMAFTVANIVSDVLFFQIGQSILFDSTVQTEKLIAVFFEIEPLPLKLDNMRPSLHG
jgi:hypothetical protein